MEENLIFDLPSRRLTASIGGKATNLLLLMEKGFRVPLTMVIPGEAYHRYITNDVRLVSELKSSLEQKINIDKKYAVRSSANIEDSLERSFAGQFKTVLDVQGVEPILQAVWSIWATANSAGVQQYQDHTQGGSQSLQMAIIIQEMIRPVISGVSFSCNPMTGASEIVVEALRGSGIRLVQNGETPNRWVYKWGEWTARPDEESIPISVIQQVVDGTQAIARSLKKTIDLEWVYDGENINWVQVREITTLKDLNIYSNRISREMVAGQIKPLIWSINIPLVISQWIKMLDDLVGATNLKPEQLAKQFHYRVYFNMGVLGKLFNKAGLPSEGLEMMMGVVPKEAGRPSIGMSAGMVRLLPRMLPFFYDKWFFTRKIKAKFNLLERSVKEFDYKSNKEKSEIDLLIDIRNLFELMTKVAYYNIVAPLLMMMYNSLVSNLLKKMSVQPDHFDILHSMPGIEQFNPDGYLSNLHTLYEELPPEQQELVRSGQISKISQHDSCTKFLSLFDEFMDRFGHLSDNGNDFSVVPWREQPELILKMISEYKRIEGKEVALMNVSDLQKPSIPFKIFYSRAREYRMYRDRISSIYTYGYGLFRPYFLELGERLFKRGVLDNANDIFYLELDQVEILVNNPDRDKTDIRTQVLRIKSEMDKTRNIDLPAIIYGDDPPPILPMNSLRLRGTPTSPGYFSGPARVVSGIEDFHKVLSGDVLVIPFSEVGWTPLFAQAGAVVAESGGVLSHSSIVAREYRIPAVVSVTGAMKLKDNQIVTVDGFKGEIILHSEKETI